MPELPVSVRVALWVTWAWSAGYDVDTVWRHALPDIDAVGGDVDRLGLWGELGERAVLVALPSSGRSSGLPSCPAAALAAAVTAGEALVAPSVGGLLVPTLGGFGASHAGSGAADRGWRVDWQAHDAEPVPVHRVTGLDLAEVRRGLAHALAEGTTVLEAAGGPVLPGRPVSGPGPRADRWAVPDGIPGPLLTLLTRAATVERACARGLAQAGPGVTARIDEERERGMRTLRLAAEQALEEATNLAVAVLAGWRPA